MILLRYIVKLVLDNAIGIRARSEGCVWRRRLRSGSERQKEQLENGCLPADSRALSSSVGPAAVTG
jgi:hypothetical protein